MLDMKQRDKTPPRQGRPPSSAGKDTRERLLDAASVLFAERGIAATTIARIAAHVGVTSAMIHYYFKTRDQLLDAIVEERIMRFIAFVWDPFTGSGDDPLSLVKGLIDRMAKASDSMPWLPSLWIREIVSEEGLLREKTLQRIPFGKLKKLGECIAAGQKRGLVNPDIHPRLVYISLIGLMILPMATARIWNRIPTMEGVNKNDLTRHVTGLLMHGLADPSPRPVSNKS